MLRDTVEQVLHEATRQVTPVEVDGIRYLTATEVLADLQVRRQTPWRWRQEGKVPAGHKFRSRQVGFNPEEAAMIREYANRIDPIETGSPARLGLFDGRRAQGRDGAVERKAVVLLSGGLDSTTALAIAQAKGFSPYALSFRYGQRNQVELDAAHRVALAMGVAQHVVADVDLRMFGGSALTSDLEVPKARSRVEMGEGIPVTYVPARNTIFLSFALAWAEVLEAADIYIGVNALDYSGYPDCRPEYIEAYQRMANLATKAAVEGRQPLRIHTPLIQLTKAEIIRKGVALGVDYGLTSSCYDPSPEGRPCGACDSCQLRAKGFAEAGIADPLATKFASAT